MAFNEQLQFTDPRIFAGYNYREGESWPVRVRVTEGPEDNPTAIDVSAWTWSAPVEYYPSTVRGASVSLGEAPLTVSHDPLSVADGDADEGFVEVILPTDLWPDGSDPIVLNTRTPPVATIWVTGTTPEGRVRKIGVGVVIRHAL